MLKFVILCKRQGLASAGLANDSERIRFEIN